MSGIIDFVTGIANPANFVPFVAGATGTYAVGALAEANKRPFRKKLTPENLVFPRDLERFSISMCFEFFEYQRRSIFKQPYRKANGNIRLPVPKGITDRFKMSWEESSDDPFVGATMEAMLEAGQTGEELTGQPGQRSFDPGLFLRQIAGVGGGALAGTALKLSEVAMSDIGNFLTINQAKILQPYGMAINPFLTVLFKQPEFKRHVFNWKMIPRNPEEARIINAIIQSFKYHALPDIANNTAGTILNYPDMLQISFYGSDNYLYRFKPCVVEALDINYAPSSTGVSFFKGSQNVPTEIDLQISLLEIEYWTKLDYDPQRFDPQRGSITGGNIPNIFPNP